MASIDHDHPEWVGPAQRTHLPHRASTISSVVAPWASPAQGDRTKPDPSSCCSGAVKRAHSVHLCTRTGMCHNEHCHKDHIPRKLGFKLRRKLSFLNKLRLRSSETKKHCAEGGLPYWPQDDTMKSPMSPSRYAVHLDPEADSQPGPVLIAEAYGDQRFIDAGFNTVIGSSTPHLENNVAPAAELSSTHVFELPESGTLPQWRQSKSQDYTHQIRTTPVHQESGISAMSSTQHVSSSDGIWSRQVSQCSPLPHITPATSMSESDIGHHGSSFQSSEEIESSPRCRLTLDTHLTIPQASITDGPLTDSPTSGDDDDFSRLRADMELPMISELPGTVVDDWRIPTELEAEVPSGLPWPGPSLLCPEEVEISSPPSNELAFKDLVQCNPSDHPVHFEHTIAAHGSNLGDALVARVLNACRRPKGLLPTMNSSGLLTKLDDLFDAPVSYYLDMVNTTTEASVATFYRACQAWNVAPTMEAALKGMERLSTADLQPTLYQLVSLTFFSYSVICLSVDYEDDLRAAVDRLHDHARSWSSMIQSEKEKRFFEGLIDELWLHVGAERLPGQLLGGAQHQCFPTTITKRALRSCDNFVVQVAQTALYFIAETSSFLQRSNTNAQWDEENLPPSYEEVLLQTLREDTAGLCLHNAPRESQRFETALHEASEKGFIHSWDAIHGFLKEEGFAYEAAHNLSPGKRISRLVKTVGCRYAGRVAAWLYKMLQKTAERSLSRPQDPNPVASMQILSVRVQGYNASGPAGDRVLKVDRKQRLQPASQANEALLAGLKKSARQKKRKSESDSDDSHKVYECKLHKKHFTGRFAYDSYQRHMEHTKQHGKLPFACEHCPERLARIDHFKTHMLKRHKLLVDGRAGNYTFRSAEGPIGIVAELDGDAIELAGQDWQSVQRAAA